MKIFVPRLTVDLKNSIKDCVLSVIFRKKDIFEFLKNSSATTSDLSGINIDEMSRSDIVDKFFSNLSTRSDQGTREIHSILDQLTGWSDFDSYWFTQGNLDAIEAKRKIEKLKLLISKKTEQEEERNKLREKQEQERKNALKRQTLLELRADFFHMCKTLNDATQTRGYALQDFIQSLFMFFGIEITVPFAVKGEQIDGAFKYEGDNYIFEAKWQDQFTSTNDLYVFVTKVDGKALYARGVFFSINGYTDQAIEALSKGKVQKTILFNSQDIIAILEEQIDLKTLLDRKIKAAQTKGEIFVTADKLLSF